MPQTLLVTGAAGKLGQRVIAHLLDTHHVPPARIVAGTRTPDKLAALAAKGVQVRKLDFEDGASLASALAGVDRMLLISTDAIDRPGRRLTQHKAAVAAATQARLKHVIYTSMPNPEKSLVTFAPDHFGTERALGASGLSHTILRNSWYMEGLLMSMPARLASGKWFTAAGDGQLAYVAREDCARIAAAVLVSESTGTAIYDVTGPRKHTIAGIAALVSEVTGKPLEVVQVSEEELIQGMKAARVPDFLIPLAASIDANTRAGYFNVLSNAVEQLTGKPPQGLLDFLIANKAALTGGA
ncbi:MAG TPA: SDR family oxidoreductase [Steroidobacteraceae bacterium]|nr:SDR family oxidoreductase [Steroidobacteraceae bacterium]